MTQYAITTTTHSQVLSEGFTRPLVLHDGVSEFDMDKIELLANVRSGDYLVTLATALDIISQLLLKANHAERDNLQKIVNDLLYLSTNYELKKKNN